MASLPQQPDTQPESQPKSSWSWAGFFRNAALIVAIIAAAVYITVESAIPSLVPKNFGVVVEGAIYRSGELTPATTRSVVQEHSIKTIIDMGAHTLDTPEQRREEAVAEALGVRYIRLALYGDATGDPNQYARALRLVADPANQPVLVHCAAGSERTGCTIAMYRTILEGKDPQAALAETTDFRHDPEDNPRLTETFNRYLEDVRRVYEEGGLIEFEDAARKDGGRVTQPLPPRPSSLPRATPKAVVELEPNPEPATEDNTPPADTNDPAKADG